MKQVHESGEGQGHDKPLAATHSVTFERNRHTRLWRARCSCGWFMVGDQSEVQTRAAGHDMEWEAVT